ncbi:hypothetical protein DSO57_1001139 [Entomophthora muscae]|uniref:Uncharacterized protein n=1 Tax=Entomophthora muscae TaxID=34485 RepID=A0ACC2S0C7_9FUNG|nr:hypothetical protein DSO57_1001139 [Entomophthora muscae]
MKLAFFLPILSVFGLNNILIDTDPGVDDVLALLMALGNKDTNITAITLVFGNAVLKNATRNLVSVFHVLDLQAKESKFDLYHKKTPPRVALGAYKPLKLPMYTAGYFHGFDGLGNLTITRPSLTCADYQKYFDYNFDGDEPKRLGHNCRPQVRKDKRTSHRFTASPLNAVDEILFQLKSLPPFTLTIVALGPLTNIALAIQKDPITMSRVKRIVVMGGALLSVGNITPMAEFNFYADPHAVNVVFDATRGFNVKQHQDLVLNPPPVFMKAEPLNITLVSSTITHTTLMTRKNMTNHFAGIGYKIIPDFTTQMLIIPQRYSDKIGGLALHDPLAMGVAMNLIPNGPATHRYSIEIIDDSVRGRGVCIIDQRPKSKAGPTPSQTNIEVVEGVGNPWHFQRIFLDAAFPKPPTKNTS